MKPYHKGNLEDEFNKSLNKKGEGWLIGNFKKFTDDDIRRTPFIELKYWDFKKKSIEHKAKFQRRATEITLVLEGWIKGKVNGKDITLSKDDYVLINPRVPNNLVKKRSDNAKVLTIKIPSDPGDKVEIDKNQLLLEAKQKVEKIIKDEK